MPHNPTLIMAANHIGTPEDLPSRVAAAVASADLLVFEEARGARRTLKACKTTRDFQLFSEHKQKATLEAVAAAFAAGKVVLYMSDSGSPGFCDPGRSLCEVALRNGARIEVIPGPSSLTAAFAACPWDMTRFYCAGFLPQSKAERRKALRELRTQTTPVVILDTPYRLGQTLSDCEAELSRFEGFLAASCGCSGERYALGSWKELAPVAKQVGKAPFVLIARPHSKTFKQ